MRFRRRDFLVLLVAMATTHRAFAQKTVPRLCFLTFDRGTAEAPTERFKAFFERLRELGYVCGGPPSITRRAGWAVASGTL